jgi:hypothetical protein
VVVPFRAKFSKKPREVSNPPAPPPPPPALC